jgi:hypothetical protein
MALEVSRLSRYLEPRGDLDLTNIVVHGRLSARLLDMVLLKLCFHVRPDLLLLLRQIADGWIVARTRQRQRLRARGCRGGRHGEIIALRAVRKVALTRHRSMVRLHRPGVEAPSASIMVSAVVVRVSEILLKGLHRSAHEGTPQAL